MRNVWVHLTLMADLGLLANLKTVWDVKISWDTPYESYEILWSFFSENQKIKSNICLRNGWDIKEIFLLSHRLSDSTEFWISSMHFRKPLVERCDEVKKHNPYWIEMVAKKFWTQSEHQCWSMPYFSLKRQNPFSLCQYQRYKQWSLAQRPYGVSIN